MAQPDLRPGDGPIALIMSPTRELAKQVEEVARTFGKCCQINSVAVYGGADKNSQVSQLNKGNLDLWKPRNNTCEIISHPLCDPLFYCRDLLVTFIFKSYCSHIFSESDLIMSSEHIYQK